MKRLILLLLSCFLCCASFASCAESEDALSSTYQGPEPSVEVEASPSPTPEPRTEVGIPEELKFCDEPLYYGMTIEEIREIFGQEDETSELEFEAGYGLMGYKTIGTHKYYIYNGVQCQGKQATVEFRIFNYEGLIYQKLYGLDAVVIRWPDVPKEEKIGFINDEIKPIIENLYGDPDYEEDTKSTFRLVWRANEHDGIEIMGRLAGGPRIEIDSQLVQFWDSIGLRDEAAMYKESGKQGLTLENLNRLKEGMSYEQAEILLGPSTEEIDRYTAGGVTYITYAWEDDLGAYLKITFCDGEINSIYSSGIK